MAHFRLCRYNILRHETLPKVENIGVEDTSVKIFSTLSGLLIILKPISIEKYFQLRRRIAT